MSDGPLPDAAPPPGGAPGAPPSPTALGKRRREDLDSSDAAGDSARRRHTGSEGGWSGTSSEDARAERADEDFDAVLGELSAFLRQSGGEYPRINKKRRDRATELAWWINNRRDEYKAGRLGEERVASLRALPGWSWEPRGVATHPYAAPHVDPFPEKLEALRAFVDKYGEYPTIRGVNGVGKKLGVWINSRRSEYKKGRLAPERAAALEGLPGWRWDGSAERNNPFPHRLDDLVQFHAQHGDYPTRSGNRHPQETQMAQWIYNRRQEHKKGKLKPEHAAALEALPWWKWEDERVVVDPFPERLLEVIQFVVDHGEFPKRAGHRPREASLGNWINHKRYEFKNGRLAEDKAAELAALPGWKWEGEAHNAKKDVFPARIEQLMVFVATHGHYPGLYGRRRGEKELYNWTHHKRYEYKRGRLPEDRIAALEKLPGWSWW